MKRWWNPPGWKAFKSLPPAARKEVWERASRWRSSRPGPVGIALWCCVSFLFLSAILMSIPLPVHILYSLVFGATLAAVVADASARGEAVKRLARAMREEGYCVSCGYDLNRNTSGTCPECGAAI